MAPHQIQFRNMKHLLIVVLLASTALIAVAQTPTDIGTEGVAQMICPQPFFIEQESNDTVYLMPRKQDEDGPVSMRLTVLRDARKEGVSPEKVKNFMKTVNETDTLHEEGGNWYSTRDEKGADSKGTKWIYNSYLIYADGLLVTATVQTIEGRSGEPQCDELKKALPELIRSIKRKNG